MTNIDKQLNDTPASWRLPEAGVSFFCQIR